MSMELQEEDTARAETGSVIAVGVGDELKALGEADRAVVRENARRWSEMSEARRQRLRAQWKKLRALPPDERADLLDRAFEARSQDEATPP